ncbi:MAG: T9SS type A sorting domain-containing protein, partial [Bacteroidales bacterium]|nr:T9SS type A sorting domain-containing protein [Bacteroidales bacterium]
IRINNASTNYITLHFNQFETIADEDYLYFYNATQLNNPTLIGQISGNHTGEDFTFNTRYLTIVFETSDKNSAPGWQLNYSSGYSSVEEPSKTNDLWTLFPNPAQDYFTITSSSQEIATSKTTVTIYSSDGKLMQKQPLTNESTNIDISSYQTGIYIVEISNNKGYLQHLKLIKTNNF